MVVLFLLANEVQAQKISAFPVYQAERTDNFIIYRPSGVPVTNLRFNIDSIFSLLEVGDVTGLDTLGLWESDGTDVWWLDGNVGAGIATPATLLHLGQADGANPDYGTKARGLQLGQSPLGRLNVFQNTSNQWQFTVNDVNKFKIGLTGPVLQTDLLPSSTNTWDIGSPSLNIDTIYANDYYINDSTMDDYILARKSTFAAAGSNNEIQLNRNDILSASSNLTWNDTTLKIEQGTANIFIGTNSGNSITTGSNNTSMGFESANTMSTGQNNIFIGKWAGRDNNNTDNTFIGYRAGIQNIGIQNVMMGMDAGLSNVNGNGNIFIGRSAGSNETGSNKLYVENSNSSNPLIWGDFTNDSIKINGNFEVTNNFILGDSSVLAITEGDTLATKEYVDINIGSFCRFSSYDILTANTWLDLKLDSTIESLTNTSAYELNSDSSGIIVRNKSIVQFSGKLCLKNNGTGTSMTAYARVLLNNIEQCKFNSAIERTFATNGVDELNLMTANINVSANDTIYIQVRVTDTDLDVECPNGGIYQNTTPYSVNLTEINAKKED